MLSDAVIKHHARKGFLEERVHSGLLPEGEFVMSAGSQGRELSDHINHTETSETANRKWGMAINPQVHLQ